LGQQAHQKGSFSIGGEEEEPGGRTMDIISITREEEEQE
jgi:hypothetical protein